MRTILILGLLMLTVGCGNSKKFTDYSLNQKTFDAKALKMVEDNATIKLPSGSKGVNLLYIRSKSVDPSFVAKIEIPLSEKDSFVKYIEKFTDSNTTINSSATGKVNWWKPIKIIIEKKIDTNRGDYVHAILSQENGKFIIYIEWISI